jgi:hypothetical protein
MRVLLHKIGTALLFAKNERKLWIRLPTTEKSEGRGANRH